MAEKLDRDLCHLDREEFREGQLETIETATELDDYEHFDNTIRIDAVFSVSGVSLSMINDQSLSRRGPTFCLLVLSGLSVDAQTNAPAESSRPSFSSPPLQIRTLQSLEESPPHDTSQLHSENQIGVAMDMTEADASRTEWSVASFIMDRPPEGSGSVIEEAIHNSRGVVEFLEPPPIVSDNPLDRVLVEPFTPVGIPVGKTTVSCSVITAIKRKNPLCLLNPIVLNISW